MKPERIQDRMREIPEWNLNLRYQEIERTFHFDSFQDAVGFVDDVSVIADHFDHVPPKIEILGNKVRVVLGGRGTGGLQETDFDVAVWIDTL